VQGDGTHLKKLKLHHDTSVISHLQHEDVPEKMEEARERRLAQENTGISKVI